MKRFKTIQPDILKLYDSISHPINRYLCISHHKHVLEAMMKLSDNECLYLAAMLHDISTYLGIIGTHAHKSAQYAKEFLEKYQLFSSEELQLIYDVIYYHSDKDKVHFHEAELLKQADKDAHHLEDILSMYDN